MRPCMFFFSCFVCKWVCMGVCESLYVCMSMAVLPRVCISVCVGVCASVHVCVRPYVCVYVRMYFCECVYMCVYVRMFVSVCVYVCVFVCVRAALRSVHRAAWGRPSGGSCPRPTGPPGPPAGRGGPPEGCPWGPRRPATAPWSWTHTAQRQRVRTTQLENGAEYNFHKLVGGDGQIFIFYLYFICYFSCSGKWHRL